MKSAVLRIILVSSGVVLMILAFALVFQKSWGSMLWPWPDGRLTYIFVGSIFAAIATPIIWIGCSNELAAMKGGALNLALTYSGITLFFMFQYESLASPPVEPSIPIITGASALVNLIIYLFCFRTEFKDQLSTPMFVRGSFCIFAVVLIGVAVTLIQKTPHVFPWPLQDRTSILIGWIFMGASVYFVYGVVVPQWGNAKGQLLGFLAYDAILIGPYVKHLDSVKEEHLLSLMIYLTVICYSSFLAIYYLFFNKETRAGRAL